MKDKKNNIDKINIDDFQISVYETDEFYIPLDESYNIDDIMLSETQMIFEMGMKASKMSDKYSEKVGSIADNLICICLYPDNPTIPHWRNRAKGFCREFTDTDIVPLSNNKDNIRYKCLYQGLIERLNPDFSALYKRCKSIIAYYEKKKDKHKQLKPYKPLDECYFEFFDKLKDTLIKLTQLIAQQDFSSIIDIIDNF